MSLKKKRDKLIGDQEHLILKISCYKDRTVFEKWQIIEEIMTKIDYLLKHYVSEEQLKNILDLLSEQAKKKELAANALRILNGPGHHLLTKETEEELIKIAEN